MSGREELPGRKAKKGRASHEEEMVEVDRILDWISLNNVTEHAVLIASEG
jgi:hypothetical protein